MLAGAERYGPLSVIPNFGQGPFEERVKNLADQRIAMYQQVAPLARASLQRHDIHVQFRRRLQPGAKMREQVEKQFAREIAALPTASRDLAVCAVDTLLSFQSYDLMLSAGSTVDEIAEVYRFAITSMLG